MLKQFDLECGGSRRTCWLDDDNRLRAGMHVTLKGETQRWKVKGIYTTQLSAPPEKRWKVGGLS